MSSKYFALCQTFCRVRDIVLSLTGHFKLLDGRLIRFNYGSSPDIFKFCWTCPASPANFAYSAFWSTFLLIDPGWTKCQKCAGYKGLILIRLKVRNGKGGSVHLFKLNTGKPIFNQDINHISSIGHASNPWKTCRLYAFKDTSYSWGKNEHILEILLRNSVQSFKNLNDFFLKNCP